MQLSKCNLVTKEYTVTFVFYLFRENTVMYINFIDVPREFFSHPELCLQIIMRFVLFFTDVDLVQDAVQPPPEDDDKNFKCKFLY